MRLKLIYVTATGRSGSTLLDVLLGQVDGFFSAGELLRFWLDGLVRQRLCGCGRKVLDCDVWRDVLEIMASRMTNPIDPATIVRSQDELLALRNLPRILLYRPSHKRWPLLDTHIEVYDNLYRAIREVTGASVVIDSSKRPQQAAVLRLLPSVDAYLLHLVRDPRGVAQSMQRHVMMQPQSESDPARMARSSAARSARLWNKWNLSAEAVQLGYGRDRSKRIRYEDLVAAPRTTLESIASFLGEPAAGLNFPEERVVNMKGTHTAWGNPVRFRTGAVEIRHDDAWLRELRVRDRRVSTALTLPLLARYGYPISMGAVSRVCEHA